MMIHQQELPPKQLLLHITNTSKNFFERFAAHSKIFHSPKKVQKKPPLCKGRWLPKGQTEGLLF